MKGTFFRKNNFPYIGIICKGGELLETINNLVNYDDGQGRKYDILDGELE